MIGIFFVALRNICIIPKSLMTLMTLTLMTLTLMTLTFMTGEMMVSKKNKLVSAEKLH